MNMDLGTCEQFPPSIVEGKWFHGTYYPRTHFSRTCGDWTPDFDPTDPDGGERAPAEPAAVVLQFDRSAA
uniref:hypothetical protein n=1 Tax=uncultured Sphingomonas sp. TaxID=158754 RepID=UPI0035CB6762